MDVQKNRKISCHCRECLLISCINPLNAELNPICHLLALLGGATIVVVSRLRVSKAGEVTVLVIMNAYTHLKCRIYEFHIELFAVF